MKTKALALLTVALLVSVAQTSQADTLVKAEATPYAVIPYEKGPILVPVETTHHRVTVEATLKQHIANPHERKRILASLKEFLGASYEDTVFTYLKGGLSSASVYKFSHGGRSFVIKLLPTNNHDKFHRAKNAYKKASQLGISPRVEYVSDHHKTIITEYVSVRTASTADYEDEKKLNRLVQGIKAFHETTLTLNPVNSFHTRLDYHARKTRRHPHVAADFGIPKDFEAAVERVNSLQRILNKPEYIKIKPVHRDLDYFNVLVDEATGEFVIVDWDNAGLGNVYEDLAAFLVGHFLNSDQVEEVIEEYFGKWAPKYKPLVDVLCQEYYVVLAASSLNRAIYLKEKHPSAKYLTKEEMEKLIEEDDFPSYPEFMESLIAGSRHLKTPADYQYFSILLLKTFFENIESTTFEMKQSFLE